jgi:hypothetical protein
MYKRRWRRNKQSSRRRIWTNRTQFEG